MTIPALPITAPEKRITGWKLAVRLVAPIVILGLLWNLADGPGALALLGDMNWTYVALAFVAVNLQTLASAWRWHRVSARLGLAIAPRLAIAEYYLSQLVNQSLPGGVLGDAARAVRARHQAGIGVAALAVIIERMAGQIAMFTLLGLALAWAMLGPGSLQLAFDPLQVAVIVAGVLLVAGIIMVVLRATRRRWSRRFAQAIRQSLWDDGAWLEQTVLGSAIVAINLASFAFCALATGTSLGLEAALVIIPLVLCAMLIPATIAGWGFREGAATALFPLAGASATAGFAASLAFGLVILAASLPGLLVLVKPARTPAEPRRHE